MDLINLDLWFKVNFISNRLNKHRFWLMYKNVYYNQKALEPLININPFLALVNILKLLTFLNATLDLVFFTQRWILHWIDFPLHRKPYKFLFLSVHQIFLNFRKTWSRYFDPIFSNHKIWSHFVIKRIIFIKLKKNPKIIILFFVKF